MQFSILEMVYFLIVVVFVIGVVVVLYKNWKQYLGIYSVW